MFWVWLAVSTISQVHTSGVSLSTPRTIYTQTSPFTPADHWGAVSVELDVLIGNTQHESFAVTVRDNTGDTVLISNLFPKHGEKYFNYLENVRTEVLVPARFITRDQICLVLMDIRRVELIGEICSDVVDTTKRDAVAAMGVLLAVLVSLCLGRMYFYLSTKEDEVYHAE